MKRLSETSGIDRLGMIREEFRREIAEQFEHTAKACSTCETPGACCLDEHFVNVRISRLDGVAIRNAVGELPSMTQAAIAARVENIEPDAEFYACPLYQNGCLVHDTAKPLPCIAHACYERPEDLPPDELLAGREHEIDLLNRKVYGRSQPAVPIHAALR